MSVSAPSRSVPLEVIVAFHRLAEQELNEAGQYYERESPGLRAAFLVEAQRCCEAMVEYLRQARSPLA